MRDEECERGDVVTEITKQYREYQADGCVWRAQPQGFNPSPLDLHRSQMCSKTNTAPAHARDS